MFPRWFGWLFCLFLGYLIFVGTTPPEAPRTAEEAAPSISEKTYPALASITSADHWKRTLDPDYAARVNCAVAALADGLGLKILEEVLGTGAPAACGDTVSIRLTVWGSTGKRTDLGEITLNLGDRHIAPGLDAGLVGMRPGGTRLLVLPPAAPVRAEKNRPTAAIQTAFPPNKVVIVTVQRVK